MMRFASLLVVLYAILSTFRTFSKKYHLANKAMAALAAIMPMIVKQAFKRYLLGCITGFI
ncbi:hypothetical protein [Paenibacillus glycanilyticus]|uniref:hypothetical protein n=1 Tax=Paenibacillus glycanilyticus TaxID=126569 RepID=UPI00295E53AE|nr:hypothetical protein [Paenibacillus glycanilyticus]